MLPKRVRFAVVRLSIALAICENWADGIALGKSFSPARVCSIRACRGGFVILTTPGVLLLKMEWLERFIVGVYIWMIFVSCSAATPRDRRNVAISSA